MRQRTNRSSAAGSSAAGSIAAGSSAAGSIVLAPTRTPDLIERRASSPFGVQTRSEPDYLEYDIRGRGYMERLFFNCGAGGWLMNQ